jgi:hypothetical protein
MTASPVVLRPAVSADASVLADLAVLDSAKPLTGDVLLAYTGGNVAAAMSLDTGAVVANPFVATAGLVEMLRVAAHGAEPKSRDSRRRHLALVPRLARV